MPRLELRFVVLLALVAGLVPLGAQEKVIALKGGQIHTISDGIIDNGVVLIRGGKILDVGRDLAVPAGATVVQAEGRIITPGLIDARTSFGVGQNDGWESAGPLMPQLRIIESFSLPPTHDWIREGVTAVYVSPGPENVIGGMGAVVKLAGRREEIVVSDAAGMSMSLGEVPKASFGQGAPRTRMGEIGLIREALVRAKEYRDAAGSSASSRTRALGLEALGRVLRREVPARIQANTPDDITAAVRLGEEFNLRVVVDVGMGAYLVADRLAKAQVPVVVGPNMIGAGGGGRFEFSPQTEENAARLHKAGVKLAICTDDSGGRSVVMEAAIARAYGLPEADALKAITLDAAEILGVASRLGSLEKGKDADLVIWNRHPLSTWGRAEKVFIDGRLIFERQEQPRVPSY
jgi:imidazolonepropionase-like amidohydrolase